MAVKLESQHLLLKSSLVLGVIIFFTYLIFDLGLLSLIIASDQSKISLIILALYYLATAHWYYLSFLLDKEIEGLNFEDASSSVLLSKLKYFDGNDQQKSTNYLSILEDELANRHALGYMIVDILLKLGLTGTVIGFILMLLPIGEIKDFDPQIIQSVLTSQFSEFIKLIPQAGGLPSSWRIMPDGMQDYETPTLWDTANVMLRVYGTPA